MDPGSVIEDVLTIPDNRLYTCFVYINGNLNDRTALDPTTTETQSLNHPLTDENKQTTEQKESTGDDTANE